MKPWMGAVAVAAAMLVAPATALAGPDDPALIQFKLPYEGALGDFEALGLNMDHGMEKTADGGLLVSAWVTDEQKALVTARGYNAVQTINGKYDIDYIRAEREKSIADERAAKRALRENVAGKKGASAVAGTVTAQRADYFENNVGRFISVEAVDSTGFTTCAVNQNGQRVCTYNGPVLTAQVTDSTGKVVHTGNLSHYSDTDGAMLKPHYLYHVTVFRLGNKGDGGTMPASVKIASATGDVDTIPVREWIAKDPPGLPNGFLADFNTRYSDSQEAYKKMRDLAAEFPNISQVYDLPYKTVGYQRKAQTILGMKTPYTNATGSIGQIPPNSQPPAPPIPPNPGESAAERQAQAVVLTSKAWGHEGGNDITARLVDPASPNAALSVVVIGNAITVNLATNAAGAITSTAAQIIDAINAHPAASALVTAGKYRTNAGNGVVHAGATATQLSDFLRAPATFPRGPQTVNMLRIGSQRDGSKAGVFLYCQEHGNEIATSAVCLETAERLVRNYATDPETKRLVDGLDIFIVPMVNGDGGTHSLYDSNRRTNLSNYCTDTTRFPGNETDPMLRNSWGVDLNRNFSQGTIFDGFVGATFSDCTNGNFSGPMEFSEPESRNEQWIQSTFPNIKFANNIHSSGGYFMWPPGAYKPTREPLPYPPYGTLNYFDQTAKEVLDRIKAHRGTAIRPQRTGPVIDVLYSAAGNSADEAYYTHGIIGYDFEIGDVHYNENYDPNDPSKGTETCGAGQQPVFGLHPTNPCLHNEGRNEAMEFSDGNYGLLKSALDYANDTQAPVVNAAVDSDGKGSYQVRFTSNEASSIYFTTDGSTPTTSSTEWKPNRPRALPRPLDLAPGTTLKWIAQDFKGNLSAVKSQVLGRTDVPGTVGGSVSATLSLSMGAPVSFGAFTPGVARTYTASGAATVVSTAGDALLSVADPSPTHTGRLVNGSFALAQPLQARVGSAALANVGSAAAPLALRTWNAPVSNDTFAIDYSQAIGANEALRTGAYSKTLTYTLSTTQP